MIITLDTNVLLAALHSRSGASHQIIRLVLDEQLGLALSTPVLMEYDDVLKRREMLVLHQLSMDKVDDVLDLLVLLARKHKIYYQLRPNLPDENDNLFVECAFSSNSRYLITSNTRDFERGELQGFEFETITPGNFYKIWRERHE